MTAAELQRTVALKQANEVRIARADFKRRARAGEDAACPVELLRDPPSWAARWQLGDLLRAERRLGPKRASKLLRQAGGLSPNRTVGGIGATGRERLALALEARRSGAAR